MKAKELLRRYNEQLVDVNQGGMLFNLWFENLDDYVRQLTGKGSEILFGELERGKDYVYAYAKGDELPDGFEEDDVPAMCVDDGYNWSIWFYEIED